jgi:hypothetical protein
VSQRPLPHVCRRVFSTEDEVFRDGARSVQHFRTSKRPHPLRIPKAVDPFVGLSEDEREKRYGDHTGRQQNHIWTNEELEEALTTAHCRHKPKTFGDKLAHVRQAIEHTSHASMQSELRMQNFMYYGLYHPFNFVTGYKENDPSPRSIEWRLIILESFAGVPGFVAAGFRHFHSLRTLKRDHGWIYTLLEVHAIQHAHCLRC